MSSGPNIHVVAVETARHPAFQPMAFSGAYQQQRAAALASALSATSAPELAAGLAEAATRRGSSSRRSSLVPIGGRFCWSYTRPRRTSATKRVQCSRTAV